MGATSLGGAPLARVIPRLSASTAGGAVDIAERLEGWQRAGGDHLWRLIVSPEFGDRADLKRLTRDLVSRIEGDLGTPLEWAAAAHYDTEHPHVHIALRGTNAEGRPLRLSLDYVKQDIGRTP